ncbi:MAG: ABC transporter ATP-binding protein, partial [Candidatus Methanomethylophilaceae archaeon]|nr:ABC transporter ATP-binding protein [Candidatus Methanomethylophilaceae archaeon]
GDTNVKNFRKAWSSLLKYMGTYRKWFLLALVLAFVSTVISLIGPDLLSKMTDIIEDGIFSGKVDMDAIFRIGILLASLYVISMVMMMVQNFILATVTQRTASRLRTDISRKVNRMPLGYFDRTTTGDMLSRVTNDVDTIGQSLNQSISTLITVIATLVGSVAMMFYTNHIMAIAAKLTSIIGFMFMALIMSRSQKYFNRQQADLGRMNGLVEEIYTGYVTVRTYSGESEAKTRFDEINVSLRNSGFRSQFLGGLAMPLMGFVGNLGYVVVCVVGATLYLNGIIGFGVIVAFMMYVRFFTQSLSQISQAVIVMQSVAAASERVFELLDEKELDDENDKIQTLIDVKGKVEFRDVHFGYLPDKEVIHGFSATVLPGQKVAIVGPTGAGKTTMVNLLMRFYETNSGDILIDDVSTKDITRENVHNLFCMVLQDTWLFEGTLRENLVYSKEGVSDERLDEVCEAVGLKKFVDSLPERYDTVFNDNAAISVGQRQQITIARAMVENAPLLILDEATSSVDTGTEKDIQAAMDRLTEGRTSFVIAHRLSTIRNADLILVMKEGNIIEQGSHDELMELGGFYSELYNSQFTDCNDDA